MSEQDRLAAPFAAGVVSFKPQAVKGDRALAVAYISARDVMARLDEAVGAGGWSDEYVVLPDGLSVMCRLTVTLDGKTVTKCDVGGPSDQPAGGDRVKAAFSDAFKRAAVKFGVGRYLYGLPQVWCEFDPKTKRFLREPQLPGAAPAAAAPPRDLRAKLKDAVTDLAELRRDTYASELAKFLNYFQEGATLIADIPDDRVAAALKLATKSVLTASATGQRPVTR